MLCGVGYPLYQFINISFKISLLVTVTVSDSMNAFPAAAIAFKLVATNSLGVKDTSLAGSLFVSTLGNSEYVLWQLGMVKNHVHYRTLPREFMV